MRSVGKDVYLHLHISSQHMVTNKVWRLALEGIRDPVHQFMRNVDWQSFLSLKSQLKERTFTLTLAYDEIGT
jgi:hypothetical protein